MGPFTLQVLEGFQKACIPEEKRKKKGRVIGGTEFWLLLVLRLFSEVIYIYIYTYICIYIYKYIGKKYCLRWARPVSRPPPTRPGPRKVWFFYIMYLYMYMHMCYVVSFGIILVRFCQVCSYLSFVLVLCLLILFHLYLFWSYLSFFWFHFVWFGSYLGLLGSYLKAKWLS